MVQALGVDMAHLHDEWRAIALDLFLIRAADLELAGTVFHLGVILGHEALAQGIELMSAGTVDAVHARTAESLGYQGGLLLEVHVDDGGTGLVGQHVLAAGIEGAVPGIVGIARRVGGGAVAAVAQRHDHRSRRDDVTGTIQYVVSHGPGCPAIADQQTGDHHMIQHIRPKGPEVPGHKTLDALAFRNVDVPGRFTATGRTQIAAVSTMQQLYAQPLEKVHHQGHGPAPAPQHALAETAARFKIETDQVIHSVIRVVRPQHCQKMVVAAAQTAGALQLALIHHQCADARPAGGQSRAAAGCTGTEDEQVGFQGHDLAFAIHPLLLWRLPAKNIFLPEGSPRFRSLRIFFH